MFTPEERLQSLIDVLDFQVPETELIRSIRQTELVNTIEFLDCFYRLVTSFSPGEIISKITKRRQGYFEFRDSKDEFSAVIGQSQSNVIDNVEKKKDFVKPVSEKDDLNKTLERLCSAKLPIANEMQLTNGTFKEFLIENEVFYTILAILSEIPKDKLFSFIIDKEKFSEFVFRASSGDLLQSVSTRFADSPYYPANPFTKPKSTPKSSKRKYSKDNSILFRFVIVFFCTDYECIKSISRPKVYIALKDLIKPQSQGSFLESYDDYRRLFGVNLHKGRPSLS